jgi:hypothetical protein
MDIHSSLRTPLNRLKIQRREPHMVLRKSPTSREWSRHKSKTLEGWSHVAIFWDSLEVQDFGALKGWNAMLRVIHKAQRLEPHGDISRYFRSL